MDTECIQNVSSLDTQVRLGKDRLGKGSQDNTNAHSDKPNDSELKQRLGFGKVSSIYIVEIFRLGQKDEHIGWVVTWN